jgi:hypothetical protein
MVRNAEQRIEKLKAGIAPSASGSSSEGAARRERPWQSRSGKSFVNQSNSWIESQEECALIGRASASPI